MARKNLIGVSDKDDTTPAPAASVPGRPIAGLPLAGVRAPSPIGGITRSLDSITQKMERAQALERQLSEGMAIVELDPAQIDGSFVSDRLSIDPQELEELVEQIRAHGQQVPILVRPHPTQTGRYQVAYGHRRLAAIRQLKGKIRAVVRDLTDEDLVVSQGQENNARKNLSYVERALFALRLEERSFSRAVIMSALGVDKAALSKMLTVVRGLPIALIEAIGAAPETGRRRWLELVELLGERDASPLVAVLTENSRRMLTSDQRFQVALAHLGEKPKQAAAPKADVEGIPVQIKGTGTRSTFIFDNRAAPGFDDFVRLRLNDLFAEFTKIHSKQERR